MDNCTDDTYFCILAFDTKGGKRNSLFVLFLLFYLICLLWNLLIIIVISVDSHLQTPMYFFLRILAFVDIFYTSTTLPKLMDIFLTGNNSISDIACMIQLFLYTALAVTEIFLLTVMAFDRYVAICKPLHYTLIMKGTHCILLVVGSWIVGHINALFLAIMASQITLCGPKQIHQLFCDIKSMLKISCGKTDNIRTVIYLETLFIGVCPFLCILLSYAKIILNILKFHSTQKRNKAFSTCTSHLTVLCLSYVTLFCDYMMQTSENTQIFNQIFSVLFLAVAPTINPLIYSLKNKEIKNALKSVAKIFYVKLCIK